MELNGTAAYVKYNRFHIEHRPQYVPDPFRKVSVTLTERLHEWDVGKGVCRVGEQCKVGDELVLGCNLKIVPGFCQAIVYSILLHVHEGGIFIGL